MPRISKSKNYTDVSFELTYMYTVLPAVLSDFYGLFYSRNWVILPIENFIFFPSPQEKFPIETCKIKKLKKKISKVFKIKGYFTVTMFK